MVTMFRVELIARVAAYPNSCLPESSLGPRSAIGPTLGVSAPEGLAWTPQVPSTLAPTALAPPSCCASAALVRGVRCGLAALAGDSALVTGRSASPVLRAGRAPADTEGAIPSTDPAGVDNQLPASS